MGIFIDLLISTLTQGLIYAQLSYGVYITYKILDFPDLTVDGSFPLGAAVTAVLLVSGFNPYLALLISAGVGALAGLVTGMIHVRLKVRDLLAGIITMTALFSINLQIAGSNLAIDRSVQTIFNAAPTMALFGGFTLMQRKLIVSAILALIVKLLMDLYFKTRSGLLLRAAGNNASVVTSIAKDVGRVKIIGLVIAPAQLSLRSKDPSPAQWVPDRWCSVWPRSSSAPLCSKSFPLSREPRLWLWAVSCIKSASSWPSIWDFRQIC